jgi:AraC-like DNA-binding protein
MEIVSQRDMLEAEPPAPRERARFFVAARHDSLECLSATFRTHVYAPHAHETYVVGMVVEGCETFLCRGARHYIGAGQFTFVNPLEVHDGEPFTDGYTYRMSYPSLGLMEQVAREVTGVAAAPFFPSPCVDDPEAALLFGRAHRLIEAGTDPLAADEALLRSLGLLVTRHAGLRPLVLGRESGAIRKAAALIDQRYGEDLSLDVISQAAGLPRHLLIRAFRKETGATPHSYLVNRRALAAGALLRDGASPSDAALAVGFFDQSHLTRAFKSRFGVTPGAYRAAFLS